VRILVTGATGQDGSWITYQHVRAGDDVTVLVRRKSNYSLGGLDKLFQEEKPFRVVYGDLTDYDLLTSLVMTNNFDIIYHFGAMSFIPPSWENPVSTMEINANSTLALLNAIRRHSPSTKIYLAATSELYGHPKEIPQTINTPMNPVSPYALSKLVLYYAGEMYRKAFHIPVYVGITYNHESEIRGYEFVTMKIVTDVLTKGIVKLGNVKAKKDWGYAPEYVKYIKRIVEHEDPITFNLCTGVMATVEDYFNYVKQKFRPDATYIVDPSLYRPIEADEMTCMQSLEEYKPILKWQDVASIQAEYILHGKLYGKELV